MSIQVANADDVVEFEDGEQIFRHELEKLCGDEGPEAAMLPQHRFIPVGDPLYEQTVRFMLERRNAVHPAPVPMTSLEVGDEL